MIYGHGTRRFRPRWVEGATNHGINGMGFFVFVSYGLRLALYACDREPTLCALRYALYEKLVAIER